MADQLVIEFHEQSCRLYYFGEGRGGSMSLDKTALVQLPHPLASAIAENAMDRSLNPEESLAESEAGTGEAPEQANAETIRSAINNLSVNVDRAIALVPKQWTTLRLVRLPSSDPDEIDEMARFEAERTIPFNAQRHIVDYFALEIDEIEGARLLLAAIDSPPAERIAAIVKAASLKLQAIDISTLGLVNVLRRAHPAEEGESAVQVHAGPDTTDIVILLSGVPIFARSVPFGAKRLAEVSQSGEGERPNTVQRLLREVRRTLDYAQREFECPPLSHAYISGPQDACALASQAIQEQLGLVAEQLRFNKALPIRDDTKITFGRDLGILPEEATPALGALIGRLDSDSPSVDLTPPSYRHAVQSKKRRRVVVAVTIVVAALITGFFLSAHLLLQARKDRLEALQAEVEAREEQAAQIRDMQSVVRIISRNTQQEGSALAILDTMSRWQDLFGRDDMRIDITDFLYNADQDVQITGHALSYADLNTFVERLKTCGHFRHAMIQDRPMASAPNVSGRQVVRFTVYCYFKEDRSNI